MRFPPSTHFEAWRTTLLLHLHQLRPSLHGGDRLPTSSERRGLNVLIAVAAVGGLIASGALGMAEDPRPLDVQLSSALRAAGTTLTAWEQQLSRGLKVSLRAVADGRDVPPASQPVAIVTPVTPAALTPPASPTPR